MISLTYSFPLCKKWNEEKAKNIAREIEQCPYCSAIHTLQYHSASTVWHWHIELPDDWQFPQWELVKLFPLQVQRPVLRCTQCGEMIKVIPTFLLRGTTLTLPALIFVAFAYIFSDLTWRDLPHKFCSEDNRIAHSTLYKAVHSLGRSLVTDLELRSLCQKYLPNASSRPNKPVANWPPPKAIYIHTVIRVNGTRLFLKLLWPGRPGNNSFPERFHRSITALSHVLVKWNKPIPPLYKKRWRDTTQQDIA
jgi:hypothetical protein